MDVSRIAQGGGTPTQGAGTQGAGIQGAGGGEQAQLLQKLFDVVMLLEQALQAGKLTPGAGAPQAGAAPAGGGQVGPGPLGAGSGMGPGPGAFGGPAPAAGPAVASGGAGPNSVTVTNTSHHDEHIGMFMNGGSTTKPVAEIILHPGESGTLSYQNGQGGFMAAADSSGAYKPNASRLEFFADAQGKNNPDVSYIDGRNASISVNDGQGKTMGDTRSIAGAAPAGVVSSDAAGRPTITGWYDGSTAAMQAGGAFLQGQLGTGGAYIHPNDDQNKAPGTNPMTMAGSISQHFTASFGDA